VPEGLPYRRVYAVMLSPRAGYRTMKMAGSAINRTIKQTKATISILLPQCLATDRGFRTTGFLTYDTKASGPKFNRGAGRTTEVFCTLKLRSPVCRRRRGLVRNRARNVLCRRRQHAVKPGWVASRAKLPIQGATGSSTNSDAKQGTSIRFDQAGQGRTLPSRLPRRDLSWRSATSWTKRKARLGPRARSGPISRRRKLRRVGG
jgi:hypothetical protein